MRIAVTIFLTDETITPVRLARELEALRGQLAAVHVASVVENEAGGERDPVEPEDREDRQDTV